MRSSRLVGSLMGLAVLALGFTLQAPTAQAADAPGATLHLAWSAPGVSRQVYSVTITCFPSGGGEDMYLDVEPVCAQIAGADGDFEALPGYWFVNCEHYRGWAIRTTATGDWFGQPVSYDELHANICAARKATGAVFNF